MLVKTKAIVLASLRYQEKSLIVKCYTLSDGLKSYFVPSAFSNKKNQQKIAYFQPLTQLEIEAQHKNKNTLEYFKEIKLSHAYQSIPFDVVKSSIGLFLAEILCHSIQEESSNESFFEYLETAFLWLDTHDEVANFHLIFLLEITKFLGFYPEKPTNALTYFDLIEGVFFPDQTTGCINQEETMLFKRLMALKFDHSQKIFNTNDRQKLLKILLEYYSLHLENFKKPKSLEVFVEIFKN